MMRSIGRWDFEAKVSQHGRSVLVEKQGHPFVDVILAGRIEDKIQLVYVSDVAHEEVLGILALVLNNFDRRNCYRKKGRGVGEHKRP